MLPIISPPKVARDLRLEVFYDGLREPSISVPAMDFFALPHGRPTEFYSAMVTVPEGHGCNSYFNMPFRHSVRLEFTNESDQFVGLFYQIDYTLEPAIAPEAGYLHATFRRENPTTLKRDFVIADGFKGPGRFLGCSVGIRVIDDGPWYGEGEVKMYRDGDQSDPTYCGTGLEDYVGSALGLGRHYAEFSGSPLKVAVTKEETGSMENPALVSFYRWHIPDPVMFSDELRVTIQQIGGARQFKKGQERQAAEYRHKHLPAGPGIWDMPSAGNGLSSALIERQDDYCATAFVYCRHPQPVPRYARATAIADLDILPTEKFAEDKPDVELARKFKNYWR